MAFSEKYNTVGEELWRRLILADAPRTGVDFTQCFPADQYAKAWEPFRSVITDVQEAMQYEMSEFQCSWAVNAYFHWSFVDYMANHSASNASSISQ